MAGSLNKVMLIGNVGRDPEMRYTQQGTAVTTFTLATNSRSGDQDVPEWHNIVAWDKLAEQCNEYLRKGRKVYIEGRLQTRSFDNKEGVKQYRTEVVANIMLMLDKREGGNDDDDGDARGSRGGRSSGSGRGPSRGSTRGSKASSEDNTIDLDDTPF